MNISQNKFYKLAFSMMRVSKALAEVSEMLGEDDELNEFIAGLNTQHGGLNLLPVSCDEFASQWATGCYETESRALQLEQTNAATVEGHTIDWDDPVARAGLIERIGPAEYQKAFLAHRAASVIETVAGHGIRPVQSRFGRLFAVGDTGYASQTIEQARRYALSKPTLVKEVQS